MHTFNRSAAYPLWCALCQTYKPDNPHAHGYAICADCSEPVRLATMLEWRKLTTDSMAETVVTLLEALSEADHARYERLYHDWIKAENGTPDDAITFQKRLTATVRKRDAISEVVQARLDAMQADVEYKRVVNMVKAYHAHHE